MRRCMKRSRDADDAITAPRKRSLPQCRTTSPITSCGRVTVSAVRLMASARRSPIAMARNLDLDAVEQQRQPGSEGGTLVGRFVKYPGVDYPSVEHAGVERGCQRGETVGFDHHPE